MQVLFKVFFITEVKCESFSLPLCVLYGVLSYTKLEINIIWHIVVTIVADTHPGLSGYANVIEAHRCVQYNLGTDF